jgi:DNA-directed RNA polymerase specialized sigma24 family protein
MKHDSITLWLRQFKCGDQEAARQIWERYAPALVRVVQNRFRNAISPVADEEDLVQSVFRALWVGAPTGQWDSVLDRSELWWLLLAITRRKAANRAAYKSRLKRGASVVSLSQWDTACDDSMNTPCEQVVDQQPPPELLFMLEEQKQRLLDVLGDDVLRSIAGWKLDGNTHKEIACKLNVAPRTVIRKLNLIRESWARELEL